MSFVMATLTEVNFIRDLLEELVSIGDFSIYYEDQVQEALLLLESLKNYDADSVVSILEQKEKEDE